MNNLNPMTMSPPAMRVDSALDITQAQVDGMHHNPREAGAYLDKNPKPAHDASMIDRSETEYATKQVRKTELPPTSTDNMEMNQSGVRMRELGQPDGASIASDELHDSTAGNSPLQPTVALDTGESKPAVLVGSMAPLAGGGRSALLEIPPFAPIQEGDGTIIHQQPIKTNVTNDDNQLSEPNGNTEQPKRQVIDLSEPSASFAGAPKEKLSYASTLRRAVERSNDSEVKAFLTRPSREMLATLMQLAEDESTTDDTMFSAIEQALPYPKRMGAATFWIETGNNLMSESNDKIIKSLFNDNKDATWSPLMSEFV
ncbi:hypothetical protein AC1031_020230 [Aphanomyces cochlioides]|nr:hypothetical protein AC1031_020230 [Aphanomyces cochlioides]